MVDKRTVYRMYEAGRTFDEIASEVGCSYNYISDLIRVKYGKQPRMDTGKIKALWRAGWSINSIMYEMHMTEEEVRKVVIHEQV